MREPPATNLSPYDAAQISRVALAVRELSHPTQIGPYAIQQLIGEGGMGTVYKAEQVHPIRRTVAIKLIKLGMDTRQVITRFENERHALARMNHPNIANVLDAGSTESGRPYFVMEYVSGESITSFADANNLTVRRRLELFAQACHAVQHAHQKALIHRDLKPSNLLVTERDGTPIVKVIDFGVARATGEEFSHQTRCTENGQLIGTPEYMAPEQAMADVSRIDTRSDVYALGVVLYELVGGVLPFESRRFRSGSYQDVQRMICDVDPPKLSTRLARLGSATTQLAQRRGTSSHGLMQEIKSELEWIPLKAMRKDPAERYATASELAQDVENYLANRPLRAGPETTTYRVRKFIRRNRGAVAATAAMFLLLLSGIIATTWQAVRATRAERDAIRSGANAQRAADEARQVNRFLTEDLLAGAAPEVTRGREMSVREAVERAASSVATRLADQPLQEASVRTALATTFDALGLTERALSHATSAHAILLRHVGQDDPRALSSAAAVSAALAKLHRHDESEPMARAAFDRSRRLLGDDHPVTLECMASLASTLRLQQRFAEAEPLYRERLAIVRRVHGQRSSETAHALNNLAVLLNMQRRAAEAEPLYRESLDIQAKLLGPDHPAYLQSVGNFSRILHDQGKLPEAEAMQRQLLDDERRVLGDDHPSTTLTMTNLGGVLAAQGRVDEAEAFHRESFERRRRTLGDAHIDTLQSMSNLGTTMVMAGKYADAVPILEQAALQRRAALGEDHPYTVATSRTLATCYDRLGRYEEAERLFAWICEPARFKHLDSAARAGVLVRRGHGLVALKRYAEAESPLNVAQQELQGMRGSAADQIRITLLTSMTELYERTSRSSEADRTRTQLQSLQATTRQSN